MQTLAAQGESVVRLHLHINAGIVHICEWSSYSCRVLSALQQPPSYLLAAKQ